MIKKIIHVICLSVSLSACALPSKKQDTSWGYGSGSNIDITNNTSTNFFQNGKLIYADRLAGGGAGGKLNDRIVNQRYYWAGGNGLPTDGVPVPDKAILEIVSLYDRKRYRITVKLPADLETKMRTVYRVNNRTERRSHLYFGLAPGGYYEVVLMGRGLGASPDLLLARGIAKEVTDDWYDKKVPIAEQYGMDAFQKKYGKFYQQHPIPTGMEWAPIMDAYRAKQPKTDQHPIN